MMVDTSPQDQEAMFFYNTAAITSENEHILEGLSDELIVEILRYVPPIDLLQSVSRVSRRMSVVLQLVWRRQLPSQFPTYGLNLHQLQRCCLFHHSETLPKYLEMGSVLVGKRTARSLVRRGLSRACFASTTDNMSERIENVLLDEMSTDDWDSIRMPPPGVGRSLRMVGGPYWSSAESLSQDTSETLLFLTTQHQEMLVSEVAIKPDRDYYHKTYSWKNLVIKVYSLSDISERVEAKVSSTYLVRNSMRSYKVDPDQKTIDKLLDGQRPVYESRVHSTSKPESNAWQYFRLPLGVIGNAITITLIGKNARQFDSRGFYACVRRVAAVGIPLYTHPPCHGISTGENSVMVE